VTRKESEEILITKKMLAELVEIHGNTNRWNQSHRVTEIHTGQVFSIAGPQETAACAGPKPVGLVDESPTTSCSPRPGTSCKSAKYSGETAGMIDP
jgi:hypothetical protein